MQTRRDRYHAHRFISRRGAYALLHGEPDSPEAPLRRHGLASIAGLSLVLLLAAVFGVYGVLRPGRSDAWRQPGSLIVQKETGTRLVFVDGALHPVLNYASARLILGATDVPTVRVGRSDVAGVSQGLPVGIAGAPDNLPDRKALIVTPWIVCAGHTTDADSAVRSTTTLDIGGTTPGRPVADANAVLVRSGQGARYLLWHGHRLKIADPAVAAALGYEAHTPSVLADAWLSAVPTGPDLGFPTILDRGRPGPAIGALSTRVGQVLHVQTPGGQDAFYLVRGGGLSPLTALGAALVIGDPASRASYPKQVPTAIDVSAADVAAGAVVAPPAVVAGLPAAPPSLIDANDSEVCATFVDPSSVDATPTLSIAANGTASTPESAVRGTGDVATADVVHLPVGAGVVARLAPAGQIAKAPTYLITDLGVRYPLASADLLPTLGLDQVDPAPIASTLLSLVPTGPTLDPAAARRYENVIAAGQ